MVVVGAVDFLLVGHLLLILALLVMVVRAVKWKWLSRQTAQLLIITIQTDRVSKVVTHFTEWSLLVAGAVAVMTWLPLLGVLAVVTLLLFKVQQEVALLSMVLQPRQ
jgi:hypothetical protein